jgi:ABC-type multidrug transport system fused ATPase/permease subunit
MTVLGNILKVIATIVVGYIVGFILGSILGALFGIFISFFLQDIVISSQQAISSSILISLMMGGLISLFVSQVFNVLFETNLNPFVGAIPGALIGVFLVVFIDGYFAISDMNNYYGHATTQSWAVTPIMPYCSTLGRQLGSIIFPLFGAIGIIREMVKSHLELQRNRELIKAWPSSRWGLPEIPQESHPLQADQADRTTRPALSLPSLNTPAKARVFLLVLKPFVAACAIGTILSILGWQILGWNSSAKFSEGLFWASAMFAMYGYFHRYRKLSSPGETVGDMNVHERTRQWVTEAGSSFRPFPNIFLVSAFLFGFSVLISVVF